MTITRLNDKTVKVIYDDGDTTEIHCGLGSSIKMNLSSGSTNLKVSKGVNGYEINS